MSTDIVTWLRGLGLEQFASAFLANHIDAEVLPELTAEDLIGLGVTSIGQRRKMLAAIARLRSGEPGVADPPPSPRQPNRLVEAGLGTNSAERRQLTVMFCDLVGSTALSSRLDPEDLREILGAYHAAVAAAVGEFGGYVAKYMGDGVLAYFGYPEAHEHDAELAVRAALAAVDRVARLKGGSDALAARIGIATGLVVVGDLTGTGDAIERGVVGETPNLAARLQELAPANAVLIAESTRRLVGDLFDYRDLGPVAIRGIAGPVSAVQVLGEGTVESRFEALRLATLSPLIGRGEEVQLLLRRWALAKEGEGQIVLISGEAGIGKSRITAALQEQLQAERPVQMRYFCSPHRRDSALAPVIAQLERAAGFARDDAAEAKRDKLRALLSRTSARAPDVEAVVADLLALPSDGRDPPLPGDPRQKRERILTVLVEQLEDLARQRPVLFLFEDAHWADSTSLELLDRIVERLKQLPVLLMVTFRPDFDPSWTGQAQVTSIILGRLGQRETRTLAARVAGDKALPAEILDRIIEHTDGIPLCIEEMTKTLLESPLLREENGQYILAGPLPALAVPSSLHDSLMARLDRLGPARDVAQIGAAIGREFSYDIVKSVTGLPDDRLEGELDRLVDAGLIFRRGERPRASFVFKHALVQDAAYGTLLRGPRQELHAGIARVLETQAALSPGEEAPRGERAGLLAHHWARAEHWEKALEFTLEAAHQAEKLLSRPEAIRHYWQALELIERLPRTEGLNRVQCDVILTAVWLPGWLGNEGAEARFFRHVDEAVAAADEAGRAADMARLEAIKARHIDDLALFERSIARAGESGDRMAEAWVANNYGDYLGQHGKFSASLIHTTRAIGILGAEGERVLQARTMAVGGRCYSARAGKLDEALAFAGHAWSVADELDDPQLQAWAAAAAEPLYYRGLWEEAAATSEANLPVAWKIREWTVVFFCSSWQALACLKLGQADRARSILDRLFSEAPARLYKASAHGIQYAQIARAEVQLSMDRLNEALETVRQALAAAQRAGYRLEEIAAHRVLGQVLAAIGDRTAANAAFRQSLDLLDEVQCPPELAQTLLAYGRFRRGDNAQGDRALIERALRLFEEMKAAGWVEEARSALAEVSPV